MSDGGGHARPVRADGDEQQLPLFLPPLEPFCSNQSTLAGDPKAHSSVSGAPSQIPRQWQRQGKLLKP
jgi:hypothetical protein